MTVLIGLHGRLGAGKDTAFEGIHKWASERGVRAARRGFADALKLSFARLFIPDCGLDEAVNWCNTLKGHESASRLAVSWGVFSEYGTDTTIEHSITGRQALQRFGTEGHRDVFGEDFWVAEWRMTGRNSESGAKMDAEAVDVITVKNGRVHTKDTYVDAITIQQQIAAAQEVAA